MHRLRPLGRRVVHLEHGRGRFIARVRESPSLVLVEFDSQVRDGGGSRLLEIDGAELYREPRHGPERDSLASELRVHPTVLSRFWDDPAPALSKR